MVARRPALVASVLAVVVLAVGLVGVGQRWHWVEEAGTAERDGYVAQAEAILAGELPRDPFRPPLYALATAGLAHLGGPVGLTPFAAARLLSNLAALALVLLAGGFAWRLTRAIHPPSQSTSGRVGFAALGAAALTAVNPNVWILGQHTTTDMPFAALAAATLLAALAYLERSRLRTAGLVGLLAGLAAFTRGNAIFLMPPLLLAWWWGRPRTSGESGETLSRPSWKALAVAAGAGLVGLVPHWALRWAAFGDPFHDENWKNLAFKLHGFPDWSYLERVPYSGLPEVVASAPGAVASGLVSELWRFFFQGGLSQLLGTPGHALLAVTGAVLPVVLAVVAPGYLRRSSRPQKPDLRTPLWALLAAATFLAATALVFFTWGRLLLVLLPLGNAWVMVAIATLPEGTSRRRWVSIALLVLLVGLVAVKTFAFRLPAWIERHPTAEIALLRSLDEELPSGTTLAGTAPFAGRYLERGYFPLPDAFGQAVDRPELWFEDLRPELLRRGVTHLVVSTIELRDRPVSLVGPVEEHGTPVPWLEEVGGAPGVTAWRLVPED